MRFWLYAAMLIAALGSAQAATPFTMIAVTRMPTAADLIARCDAADRVAAGCDSAFGGYIWTVAQGNVFVGDPKQLRPSLCIPITKDVTGSEKAIEDKALPWLRAHDSEQSKGALGAVQDALTALYTCDPNVLKAIDREIAATGYASEANEFIPVTWRNRVHPIRSEHLDSHCADFTDIRATSAVAARQAFVYQCGSAPVFVLLDPTLHWVSANDLSEIDATRLAPHAFWRGAIAYRGNEPLAFVEGAPSTFISANGQATDSGFSSGIRDLDPSGRYILRYISSGFSVVDTATNAQVFSTDGKVPLFLVRAKTDGSLQLIGSRRNPDCIEPHILSSGAIQNASCPPEIVILDAKTGNVHRIAIPNGLIGTAPRQYGERQALVDIHGSEKNGPGGVSVVDFDQLRVVWSGTTADAPFAHAVSCGRLEYSDSNITALRPPLHVSLNGDGFILQAGQRTAPNYCAVTGDQRKLAVVAMPFIHYYSIDP